MAIKSNCWVSELMGDIGRNEPCFCGSGKKYKHCCMNIQGAYATRLSKIHFKPRQKETKSDKKVVFINPRGTNKDNP